MTSFAGSSTATCTSRSRSVLVRLPMMPATFAGQLEALFHDRLNCHAHRCTPECIWLSSDHRAIAAARAKVWPQLSQKLEVGCEYLPQCAQRIGRCNSCWTITFGSADSCVSAQIKATIHPMMVQPKRILSQRIAVKLRLFHPAIDGRK
jgi:hypothetical protein